MQLVGRVPLQIGRQVARLFAVVEIARLVLEIHPVGAGGGIGAIADEGLAGDGRSGVGHDPSLTAAIASALERRGYPSIMRSIAQMQIGRASSRERVWQYV